MGFKDLVVDAGSGNYLKTPVGTTKVRIVSEPVKFWKDFDGKKQYVTEEGAKANPEAKVRYSMWVIDRGDGKIKVWECSGGVVKDIVSLANNPEYAFDALPPFDLLINRVGSTLQETRYTLTPARANTALTDEENVQISVLEPMDRFLNAEAEDKNPLL